MDEDDDSDIDIITERKDGSKPPPSIQPRYSEIRNIPQRSTTNETAVKPAPIKREEPRQEYPPVSNSTVDVNAIPVHKPSGKPITQVDIDKDLPDNDKPWRKPGTDLSDYFNYGFDEFTWALYAQKQEALRAEYDQEAIAQNNKRLMEEMSNMMMMGGMMPPPGAPTPAGAAAGGAAASAVPAAAAGAPPVAAFPGMEGLPPEMQAMLQQMIANGTDPAQMDMAAMAAMYGGMQNAGAGAAGAQAGQGQGFAGGFSGNQGQGYGGYEQQMGGGGRGGRGRGRRW
ncbi:Fip1-domain-containing protein [Canariomyces notabilis]|uniref:Fip1-domain-containing protein n=1 Tax=Canariomyces notabilis TaxID=2074819 RepID=A0AAN6TEA0_9PEZI|nr:Fip1-domain-containing protein [Canariomyces arenarius]